MAQQDLLKNDGGTRLEFRLALPLVLIVFLDAFSLTIILPLLPYYATAFGIGVFGIGVLVAVSPILETVSAPLHRALSKRLGRRPILIISAFGSFLGFLMLGVASSAGMLYLGRIVDGISSGNNTVGRRLIRDMLNPENRAHGMGHIEAAYTFGFLAGPVVGFLILWISGDDYRLIPFIAAGISLIFAFLLLLVTRKTLPPEKRKSSGLSFREKLNAKFSPVRRPIILLLFLILFIELFSFIGFLEFSGLFTLERLGLGALEVMVGFLIGSLILIAVQLGLVGRLTTRFGEKAIILAGLGILGVGLILVATTPSEPVPWYSKTAIIEELTLELTILGSMEDIAPLTASLPPETNGSLDGLIWLTAGFILVLLGTGLLTPTINSLLMYNVPTIASGTVLGISSGFYKAVQIAAPLVLGYIFLNIGFTIPYLAGGILLFVLLFISVFLLKSKPDEALADMSPPGEDTYEF